MKRDRNIGNNLEGGGWNPAAFAAAVCSTPEKWQQEVLEEEDSQQTL